LNFVFLAFLLCLIFTFQTLEKNLEDQEFKAILWQTQFAYL
jgi:hypothetical protein